MPLVNDPALPRTFGWRTMMRLTGAIDASRWMWSSSNDAMPTECPLPPTSKIAETICSSVVEAAVLEDRQHRRQLLAREAVRLADLVFLHDDERLARRAARSPAFSAMTPAARATVSMRAAPLGVPHRRLELALLLGAGEVAAFLLQRLEERVVDRRFDQQVAVARAARPVVLGLADPRVHRGLGEVGGLVDDDRGVAGADAVGRLAGAVGGLHHRRRRRSRSSDRRSTSAPARAECSASRGRGSDLPARPASSARREARARSRARSSGSADAARR